MNFNSIFDQTNAKLLNFSQSTVGDGVMQIFESMMKKGYVGQPMDVVLKANGVLVSLDNRRLLAGKLVERITKQAFNLNVVVHPEFEKISSKIGKRFQVPPINENLLSELGEIGIRYRIKNSGFIVPKDWGTAQKLRCFKNGLPADGTKANPRLTPVAAPVAAPAAAPDVPEASNAGRDYVANEAPSQVSKLEKGFAGAMTIISTITTLVKLYNTCLAIKNKDDTTKITLQILGTLFSGIYTVTSWHNLIKILRKGVRSAASAKLFRVLGILGTLLELVEIFCDDSFSMWQKLVLATITVTISIVLLFCPLGFLATLGVCIGGMAAKELFSLIFKRETK